MQQSTSQPFATSSIHRSYGVYIDGVQEFPEVQELKERAGSESATVEIMIGRGTSEEELNDVLLLLKDDVLVPKLGVVSITADKVAWTTNYSASKVQGHLPRNITTVVTVYDSNKRIQSTVVRYDEDLPSFSLATLPVDAIDATDTSVTDVFCDPGLHVLILQPPRNRSVFVLNVQAFQEELIHSLQMAAGLRKVSVPLDFARRIKDIVTALKDIESITTLELTRPRCFNMFNLPPTERIQVDNGLLRLEPWHQLERLAFDKTILSLPLLEMAERMFDTKMDSADGQSVIFQTPSQLPL